MAYVCELNPNQTIYLENAGAYTVVTQLSHSPGQQQQSTTRFETGAWTAPPEMSHTTSSILFRISTSQGEQVIQAQGSSLSLTSPSQWQASFQAMTQSHSPTANPMPSMPPMASVKMEPMPPLPPLPPMKMGEMEMTSSPMTMRMGDMQMTMGNSAETIRPQHERRFCSQCGAPVQPTDRFCASCGHQLV
ncbi:MAG: zinc ribbon domain-containing protein [Synechococcales bacterium]|nr:zinc ribbon domain-containing protein [Synechococcales bacterium]